MKYLLIICSLMLSGCGGSEKNILLATGKVPPRFFHFSSKKDMDNFVLDTRKYSLLMPQTKAMDFRNGRNWKGGSDRDGNSIGFFNETGYHIDISTGYTAEEYKDGADDADRKSISYINYIYKEYKYPKTTKMHYDNFGRENYNCLVTQSIDKFKRYKTVYHCYKPNPEKTKARSVRIILTYSKPTNPSLAKQYTYADLKRRAKRMLDSLYIKDGW